MYKELYVNCTSVKTAYSIFSRVAKELNIKVTGRSEKEYISAIENYLSTTKEVMYVFFIKKIINKMQ